MVTVNSFTKRQSKDGRSFLTMELVGGIEMVQSQSSGMYYAKLKKCSVPATFDESIADSLVGTKLPGEIVRILCDPYEYTIQSTGEVVILQHTFGYQPTNSGEVVHMDRRELVEA